MITEIEEKPRSTEEWLKLGDEMANQIGHLMERFKNRLTRDNLRLSERYIKSELQILALLRVGQSHHFIASMKGLPDNSHREHERIPNNVHAPRVRLHRNCQYESVLIDAVEFVDMPERTIASDVRLYTADEFLRFGMDLLYFSLANGRCILLGTLLQIILTDREVRILPGGSAISLDKLPSQMIKGASQVVDSISDDCANLVGNRLDAVDIEGYVRNLRYVLGPQSIGFRIAEGSDSNIQIADVLFGPFNF